MTTPFQPAPDVSAYVQETLALLGDRDPIAVLTETPEWILQRIGPLDFSLMNTPEGPGKWSLTQVLAHLADTELAMGWRARQVLTETDPPLHAFDQDAWRTRFDGAGADPTEAMLVFTALRSWNLRIWQRCNTPEDLARMGMHSERGPQSMDTLNRMAAGHDLRHRRQIERILAATS